MKLLDRVRTLVGILTLSLCGMGASVSAWAVDNIFNIGTLEADVPYTQLVTHLTPIEPVGTAFTDQF